MKRLIDLIKSPEFVRIAAVFAVALAVRMLYLYEIFDNPFFRQLLIDEVAYDGWARRIAAGEWVGKGVFYQDPLYPYFLGVIYSTIGRDFLWVRVIQLTLGSASCVFIYLLAKSFFNARTGLIAGLIAALYKPFFYFEGMFLKTFLGIFLLCLFLVIVVAARRGNRALPWTGAGLLLGMLVLVRSNSLALAGAVVLWLFVSRRPKEHESRKIEGEESEGQEPKGENLRDKLAAAVCFIVGLAIVLSTVAARNYIVGKDVVMLTSQAGQNFFIGNNRWNDNGRYRPPRYVRPHPKYEQRDFKTGAEKAVGHALKPSEVSAFWFGKAFSYIAEEPGRWAGQTWTKFRLFWNWYEVPDNQNFYFFSRYSRLLRLWLPDFRIVAVLGLCGMVFCLRRWRELSLLYLVVILYSGSVVAFYLFSRYRLPVVPGLIIFAAALLDGLPAMIAEKKYPKLGSLALLTVALLVFISVDVTPADYVLDEANAHCRLAAVRLKEDRFDDALSAYEKALDISPTYWAAHLGVASAQERKGNLGAALESYEKAAKLAPGIPDPHVRAGHILFQMRELERSAAHYGEALKDDPRKPGLHRRLAVIHNILGNEEEAQAHIEKAAQLLAERASGP